MSNMTPKKLFIVIVFKIYQTFHWFLKLLSNLMYMPPANGLKIEIFTYLLWTDSIAQPNPSLIQLSILYKIS